MISRFFFVLMCAAASATLISTKAAYALESPKAWAYQAWWMPDAWKKAPLAKLDRLLFFEIKVSATGNISDKNGWPERWTELSAELQKTKTPLDLTLTLLNPKDFSAVFSSDTATSILLEQAANLASDKTVAGLHLDFEVYTPVAPTVQLRFQKFVIDLAKKLKSIIPAKNLSVFLPIGGTTQIYSAAALAQVNHVVAQGYDAHWVTGPSAGPVAPLDGESAVTWKSATAQALALGVKKNKILLSYPFYGYEWQTADKNPRGTNLTEGSKTTFATLKTSITDLPNSTQERLKRSTSVNDPKSGSSYYQFKTNEKWTTGWYEGEWAMRQKIQFVEQQKIAGMAFFVLGYDEGKLLHAFVTHRPKLQKAPQSAQERGAVNGL
jgi:spore germination protein